MFLSCFYFDKTVSYRNHRKDARPCVFTDDEMFFNEEFAQNLLSLGEFADFYFWRDHIGNEIDLIADEGTFLHITEIKSAKTIRSDFFKHLDYFKKISPFPVSTSSIIYGGETRQQRSGSSIIPWKELSAYLDNL